eukprot:SAG31_NODE_154_length_22184_cov_25.917142_2_plen_177_part_00
MTSAIEQKGRGVERVGARRRVEGGAWGGRAGGGGQGRGGAQRQSGRTSAVVGGGGAGRRVERATFAGRELIGAARGRRRLSPDSVPRPAKSGFTAVLNFSSVSTSAGSYSCTFAKFTTYRYLYLLRYSCTKFNSHWLLLLSKAIQRREEKRREEKRRENRWCWWHMRYIFGKFDQL